MSELSPQEKRARLEASYAASYGTTAEDPRIRELVIRDLELVDAAERAGDLDQTRGPLAAPGYSADRPKPQEIVDAEVETGVRLLDEEDRGEPIRSTEFDANPLLTSEKWSKAGARVARILEGMGGSSDFRAACSNAAVPELALEYTELYADYMSRHRNGGVHIIGQRFNPFTGMSEQDAVRMLVAKVYDICDRSTGKLGWWYVK